ncbi:IucA/IucC family protein [Paenibacillus sp. PL2-23]|uniref:IucA/IucC family protein n=1 Tax=Paenibacillus sp. PL2-23 TaxID=2100729 RepID=UPI0030F5C813
MSGKAERQVERPAERQAERQAGRPAVGLAAAAGKGPVQTVRYIQYAGGDCSLKAIWQKDVMAARALQSEAGARVLRRIFRQLVESVIYEGIVTPRDVQEEAGVRFELDGTDAEGRQVVYWCMGRRRDTFGRIRLLSSSTVMRRSVEGESEAGSLRQFVWETLNVPGTEKEKLSAFAEELEQTCLKDTIAQYIREQSGASLRGLDGDALESAVMDGHRYHPSYKSRIGFDLAEHLAYGPEFAQDLTPLWLAVRREDCRSAVLSSRTLASHMVSELGEEGVQGLLGVLRAEGCEPELYELLPVHPWQWRHAIAAACGEELRMKRMVMLGTASDVYRAQQSIRSWANRSNPEKAYMKLSMNLVNTSSSRQLLPHYTVTAPALSDWLQTLVDGDTYLRKEARVILLRETAAISYDPPSRTEARHPLYAAAGCIWRESIHRYLEEGEGAAPFFALFAEELDGTPFIDPWLQAYGIEPWLLLLLERCMLPVVHLSAVHGVALEAHAQNMVLVHRNGLPERVALKDFHEDVLYHPAFLSQPELCPDLSRVHECYEQPEECANFEADSVDRLRYLTLGALLFVNLGELAMLLEDKYGYSEARFWRLAAQCIHHHQQRHEDWSARFETLDLFAPTTWVERLTCKRLTSRKTGMSHEVPNPLFAYRRQDCSMSREEISI